MVNDKVYCGQCGGANPASNKFCGKCGAILDKLQDLQEKTSSTLPPIPSPHPNACPKCKNIDQIQKLSTIVSAGTRNTSGVSATTGETNLAGDQRHYARGTGYVGSSELSGKAYSTSSTFIDATEKTDLAKRLSPPRKPQEPVLKRHGFAEWMISTGGVVAVVAGIVGAAMLAEPWGIIGGIVGFIGGIVGAFFLGVGFDSLVFGSSRKILEGIFQIEKEEYAKDISVWEKATRRWETMYYCYRDDIVFVPGETAQSEPAQGRLFRRVGTASQEKPDAVEMLKRSDRPIFAPLPDEPPDRKKRRR